MQIESITSNNINYKSNSAEKKIKKVGEEKLYKAAKHSQYNENAKDILILSIAVIISFLPATIINISNFFKDSITDLAESIYKKLQK